MQILYTNDLHGKVKAMGKISALVGEARKSNSSTILLDAGDWAKGSSLSDRFKGKPMIEIMNKIGYNAAGIGEGDLSWGIEILRERAKEARFPILCSNVADEAGQKIENIHSQIALKAGDFRIAVLAVISKEVKAKGFRILDPGEAIENFFHRIKADDFDFIILLSQLGLAQDIKIASMFSSIKVIIGGRSHEYLERPLYAGRTAILQSGSDGRFLGALSLVKES